MPKTNPPDVPNARFWLASTKETPGGKIETLFLECERWFDARRVARTILRAEVDISQALPIEAIPRIPRNRVQARWNGSGAGARLEVRRLSHNGKKNGSWEVLA